jgi:hypothetical protein
LEEGVDNPPRFAILRPKVGQFINRDRRSIAANSNGGETSLQITGLPASSLDVVFPFELVS